MLNLFTKIQINVGFQMTRVLEQVIMAPATHPLNVNLKVEKMMVVAQGDLGYAVHVSSVAR